MKQFFKMTFATICGIAIFLAITGLFFVISLVGMVASDTASTKVKDNSVFVISMNGMVNERSEEGNPLGILLGQADMSEMGLDDLITAIRKAKENENVKGIYLEGGAIAFDSPATAQQMRDALKDFKKSGKWIVSYADNYTQGAYYVASVADSIYLNKTGMIDFKGLGGKSEYFKGLYDKLGVKYQAVRVGKYKSAVERQILTSMSERDREQRLAYQQGIWNHWLKDIGESRKLSVEALNKLANDSIMMFANPNDYIQGKLVDKLMYPEEIKKEIKSRLKLDKDKDIPQLMLSDMLNVKSKDKKKGEEIAVYYAYGEIVDVEASLLTGGEHSIMGRKTIDDLNELADDEDVKAVVLRVNSPGGSAVASEQIWHAIKQLKAKKPVVVSMGGLAASGGYMISAGADYIIAEPTTITGSIGIFGLIPNFAGLVTDKLGVTFDGVKTNNYTDYMENLTLSKDNEKELEFMQSYVDRGYVTFLDIVADGRKMKRDEVDSIAQGRVWLAKDAIKIKLVDKLGSLDDAVKKAAELAKLDEYHTAAYPGQSSWIDQFMPTEERKGTYLDGELRAVLGDLYEPFMELRRNQQRNQLQARFPYSTTIK
ncbi:MAG: signal peptide peptidase SppA [Prevotella sp.]|nr:signal peptide peptidase SppA [Prevotella sp.]